MKKALSFFSFFAGNVMIAAAQVSNLNVGGTINGVPVSVSAGGSGGTFQAGQVASQGQVNGGALFGILDVAQKLVSRLVPFAIGVATLAFFWFLIRFIMTESAEEKQKGMKGMGYSILAMFVMVSIWGIIGALGSMLGVGQGGNIPVPGVPVPIN